MTCPQAVPERPVRVVIRGTAWDAAVRRLLLDPASVAQGTMRGGKSQRFCEYLIDELHVEPAAAEHSAPFLLRMQSSSLPAAADTSFAATGRTNVVVTLDAQDRGRWQGQSLCMTGPPRPVQELRVIGPGLLRLDRRARPASRRRPNGRWSRQAAVVGDYVHRWLREATITIVGLGRMGTLLATTLVSQGVQRLRLLDPDTVNSANLDCLPGLPERALRAPKVTAVGRLLLRQNRHLSITALQAAVHRRQGTRFLDERSDLLVTCVDDDLPRLAVSFLARRGLMPHLDLASSIQRDDAGNLQIRADARLFVDSGCICCIGGLADPRETFYELVGPEGSLSRRRPLTWHEQRAGSLNTLNMLCVGSGVQMVLDLLAGQTSGSMWQRLRWTAETGLSATAGPVAADDRCPYCRQALA
jgi:hypothetical protein